MDLLIRIVKAIVIFILIVIITFVLLLIPPIVNNYLSTLKSYNIDEKIVVSLFEFNNSKKEVIEGNYLLNLNTWIVSKFEWEFRKISNNNLLKYSNNCELNKYNVWNMNNRYINCVWLFDDNDKPLYDISFKSSSMYQSQNRKYIVSIQWHIFKALFWGFSKEMGNRMPTIINIESWKTFWLLTVDENWKWVNIDEILWYIN